MEYLRELTRNLILVILLASFLQMLLPQSNLNRYLRLVVGLFVLLTIVQPLLSFLEGDRNLSFATAATEGSHLSEILDQGQQMGSFHEQEALKLTEKHLAQQLEALVYLIPEINFVQAEPILEKKDELVVVKRVLIRAVLTGEGLAAIETVEPIEVGGDGTGSDDIQKATARTGEKTWGSEANKIEQTIKRTVSAYLGLGPQEVQIIFDSD